MLSLAGLHLAPSSSISLASRCPTVPMHRIIICQPRCKTLTWAILAGSPGTSQTQLAPQTTPTLSSLMAAYGWLMGALGVAMHMARRSLSAAAR